MIRKHFYLWLVSAMLIGGALVSCGDDDEKPDNNENPGNQTEPDNNQQNPDPNNGQETPVDDKTYTPLQTSAGTIPATAISLADAKNPAEVMKAMMPSNATANLSADTKDYDIYVIADEQKDTTLKDIRDLKFTYTDREGKHQSVPLSKIATFEETDTLNVITRDSQTKYISVTAGVDADHNITFVGNDLKNRFKDIDMIDGYSISMSGEDEMILDAMTQISLMLALAVVFIYLIMVAQFQSLLSPFIIMFTIPLAFTGGFFALFVTKNNVSVIGALGFVMLQKRKTDRG